MPLHKIEWTDRQRGWAVWHITENERALEALAFPETSPDDINSPLKRLEWLAGKVLLKSMVEEAGLSYQGVRKDAYGKPFLNHLAHAISLSHSYPYVAAQIDLHAVGIDVEQPKDKLLRIAHRVLDPTEESDAGNNITKNCIYWCAKEALYKMYGLRGLSFSANLRIEPFSLGKMGDLRGKISANGSIHLINLGYSVEEDYVLVFTK